MKAFAITGLTETGYVEKNECPVGAGEVRLKVDYVGFCGSDLNTYRGLFPIGKMLTKAYDFSEAGQALADWNAAPGKVCRFLVKVS